jgi:hypothetical protein
MTSPFRLAAWYHGHVLALVFFDERLTGHDLTARSLAMGMVALGMCVLLLWVPAAAPALRCCRCSCLSASSAPSSTSARRWSWDLRTALRRARCLGVGLRHVRDDRADPSRPPGVGPCTLGSAPGPRRHGCRDTGLLGGGAPSWPRTPSVTERLPPYRGTGLRRTLYGVGRRPHISPGMVGTDPCRKILAWSSR